MPGDHWEELLDEMDPEDKKRLLKEALAAAVRKKVPTAVGPDAVKTSQILRDRFNTFMASETFAPGQLVVWKPGLKNRKRPEEGEPAIVVQVLEDPVFDEQQGPGSAYYRERLDVVLGLLDEDGDFLLFHFDSRRFTELKSPPNPKEERS